MMGLFFLVDQIAIGIYALLIGFMLWHLYRFVSAQGEVRATYYELERDLARQRRSAAVTMVIIAIEVGLIVLGIQQQVVPFLESERTIEERLDAQRSQIQDGVFATDTPPAAVAARPDIPIGTPLGGDEEIGFITTPTLTPTPAGTIVPNAPPAQGCTDERAFLVVPENGMRVFDTVVVEGTANIPNFGEAKLEIKGPGTNDQYLVIRNIDQPIPEPGPIAQFSPAIYTAPDSAGLYQFRLVVFDSVRELRASCMVNIYINQPPLSPTPTATPGTAS